MMEMQEFTVQEDIHFASTVVVGGTYRHYKGNEYKVLAISASADDQSLWVVYECLYKNPVRQVWHRRLEEFTEIGTWVAGQAPCPRFRRI